MKYLWLLFLLTLPFQLGKHFWLPFSYIGGLRIDYLSPVLYLQDILLLIIAGICFWQRKKELRSIINFVTKPLFVIVALFSLVNITASFSPYLAIYSFLRLGQVVLLIKIAEQEKIRILIALKMALPISAISQLFISVGQIVGTHSLGGLFYWLGERSFTIATPDIAKAFVFNHMWLRPYGTFSHPNSLAGFMLLIFVLSWGLLSKRIRKLTLLSSFLVVVLSFSQSAWLGLVGVLIYLILTRYHVCFRLPITLIATITFIVFIVALFPQLTNLDPRSTSLWLELANSSSYTLRLSLLKVSWSILLSHSFFGVGFGNFIIALGQQAEYSRLIHWYQPVHNIFVLWVVETGLIGIGILIYLVKCVLTLIMPLFNQQPNTLPNNKFPPLNLPLNNHLKTLIIIVVLITGSLDHYWLTLIQNRLLLAVVLGLLFSCYDKKLEDTIVKLPNDNKAVPNN